MRRVAVLALLLVAPTGCEAGEERDVAERRPSPSQEERLSERLSGSVRVATAPVTQPFTTEAAANFEAETPVKVEVHETSSRAALARLCGREVAIAVVDRPIRAELRRACRRNGVEFVRIHIGWLAVAVAASSELGLDCVSLGELRRVWRPGSRVDRYELYGAAPGTAAFELFTREVVGGAGAIRAGWSEFEDAATIEHSLATSDRALAFVNREVLHPLSEDISFVAIDAGGGCRPPSPSTIRERRYPLVQALHLYVSRPALEQLRVRSLARFMVQNYRQFAATVRTIVPADQAAVEASARRLPAAPIPGG